MLAGELAAAVVVAGAGVLFVEPDEIPPTGAAFALGVAGVDAFVVTGGLTAAVWLDIVPIVGVVVAATGAAFATGAADSVLEPVALEVVCIEAGRLGTPIWLPVALARFATAAAVVGAAAPIMPEAVDDGPTAEPEMACAALAAGDGGDDVVLLFGIEPSVFVTWLSVTLPGCPARTPAMLSTTNCVVATSSPLITTARSIPNE